MARKKKVRYAVVGLGHFAQVAVLPAFANAKRCELTALVSDDPAKLDELSRQYGVEIRASYDDFDPFLASGQVDAVYLVLPNHLHRDYTVRAARAGVHVLCEKPMAVTEEDCREMIRATDEANVKLMIAYRLHLEEANLKTVEVVTSGQIGEPRIFNSLFSMNVTDEDNIRLDREKGGGTLYDIGVYCINAARYLFRDEPIEVSAFSANNGEPRFREVDEMTTCILRFPGERLASFTCSFGAADVSSYQVVGTRGDVRLDPAYEYRGKLKQHLTIEGKTKSKTFNRRDQIAAELTYFSDCILKGKEPEPNGREGLADVRVVRALYRSAETRQPVELEPFEKRRRPQPEQEIERPAPWTRPEPVHAEGPRGNS
ncbi:MAG: Gfo/Idh/MocA family oxidoreductase [Pirellulales bacterium]